jgi:hypothetical protein
LFGPPVERADRREVGTQPVDHELAQALRAEVLEAVLAEAAERDAGRQLVGDDRRRCLGEEDLAAVARGGRRGRPGGRPRRRSAVRVEPPSPVWIPIRTGSSVSGQGSAASARCASTAPRPRRRPAERRRRSPSPSVATSTPPWAATAARISSR